MNGSHIIPPFPQLFSILSHWQIFSLKKIFRINMKCLTLLLYSVFFKPEWITPIYLKKSGVTSHITVFLLPCPTQYHALSPHLLCLPLSPSPNQLHISFLPVSASLFTPFSQYTVFLSFSLSLSVILIVSPCFSPLPPTLTHLAGCLLFKPLLYSHKHTHTERNEERKQQRGERQGNLVWLQTSPSF